MKKILILAAALFLGREAFAETVIEEKASIELLNPSLAARKTLKLRLDNGLEALLISDPNAEKSGALLAVKVGSWDDPIDHPGIAHFTEHLLFLGTKSYPEEGEYHRYIRDHGGATNAFTTNDTTCFMFSVDNGFFEGALDRFAAFFKEPLFNESGVKRELQAVDQEYSKNLEDDGWREVFLQKELAKEEHPYHRFNIGNIDTLKNSSGKEVKEWYEKHYSANLMRLMVVSKEPLERLQKIVIEEFSSIPSTNRAPFSGGDSYSDPQYNGKLVVMRPVKNERSITISWELPEKFALMKEEKPAQLISYLLGDEGEESLLAELKREGLADKLSSGVYDVSSNHQNYFVSIDLTDKGAEKLNLVVERLFQAISRFGNRELPQYLFDEVQKMQTLNYQYQQRKELFNELMQNGFTIQGEAIETYPIQSRIIQRFDPKAVKELFSYLTPQNALFLLKAPVGSDKLKLDKKEKWFDIPYTILPINSEQLDAWKGVEPHPKIDLPEPNPFVPNGLQVLKGEGDRDRESGDAPIVPPVEVIADNDRGLYYYSFAEKYLEPKVSWFLEIKSPEVIAGNPTSVALTDLALKFFDEQLKRYSYPAELAGLNYSLSREDNGIGIKIVGYNEKAMLLLEKILQEISQGALSAAKFNTYKETLLREYENFSKESPLDQNSEQLRRMIYKDYVSEREKEVALKKVTFKRFQEFQEVLFDETYVEGIFYGNMDKKSVAAIEELMLETFPSRPYPKEMQLKREVIDFPEKSGPFFIEKETSMRGNSLILAIEYLPYSLKARAAQQLLMQGISEPFFSELRTKQQTGYIVFSQGQDIERHLFNLFAVQSNSHTNRDLLARFELFLESFLQEMRGDKFDKNRFEAIKGAILHHLKHPAHNIPEMGNLLKMLAFDFKGDFEWIDKRIKAVEELEYEEFIALSREMLGKENKKRVAFMIKGVLPKERLLEYNKLRAVDELRRISTFTPAEVN